MRTRRSYRNDGFTMAELLVTIVCAAIFFGAMIPFLASAQNQTSYENMRNIALQIARSEIEQIHSLDYPSVNTTANAGVLGSGQFPTQWTETTGSSSKVFYIGYNVTAEASTATTAAYKLVSVSVSWAGAPQPDFTDYSGGTPVPSSATPIVLTTQVSQQYNGPQIVDLTTPNANADSSDPNNPVYTITAGSAVLLVATVAPQDLSQLDGTPAGQVSFAVTDMNGNAVASGTSTAPTTSGGDQYQWSWDASSVSTGYYIFTATAQSGSNASGNTWPVTYYVQSNNMAAPTLSATAGDGTVNLSWTAIADADHYQVLRATTSGQEQVVWTGASGTGTSTTYLDSGLLDGTTYYYEVCAVDGQGNQGALSAEVTATPAAGSDTTAPIAPTNLAVNTSLTTNTAITLTWTASQDNPPNATGVVQYTIWRSPTSNGTYVKVGAVNGTQAVPPATTYTDSGLSNSTTYYYEVYAVDGANNVSQASTVVSGMTLATSPTGSLTVDNTSNGNKTMSVTVYNIATHLYYTPGGSGYTSPVSTNISNKGTGQATWATLPVGPYQVTATYSSSTSQQASSVTAGNTATVKFSF